jgi:iron complex outermembrane receptor protein
MLAAGAAFGEKDYSGEHLRTLSIDELADIEITSVTKTAEPLSDAPAAIYVITHDDILRSSALTLPELLRQAPNLQVAQVSGSGYAITARGFNGTTTSNGAGNKLLALIDGRSIYTPLYAGVFWDLQYVLPEDIERIEVISGPGATLWGANAVNGVINIVTRDAAETRGLFAAGSGGSLEQNLGLRHGSRIGTDAAFRVYAMGYWRGADENGPGAGARDGWNKYQGGFRFDWTPGSAHLTLQGDAFSGREDQASGPSAVIAGHNLLARWTQPVAGGTFQLQAYYDYTTLYVPHGIGDAMRTYDIDAQHSFAWGERHEIVWGGGFRLFHDSFSNTDSTLFLPPATTHTLANLFVQDTIALSHALKLTLGTKFEDDPFVGIETLPSARIAWKAGDRSLIWASVSRAVRAPSLWDRNLHQVVGGFTLLAGGRFKSETLVAYEAGYRGKPLANLSLSANVFYNVYDRLRSVEFSPGPAFPLVYGNLMEGETYGLEAWAGYGVTENWVVSAGINLLEQHLRLKPQSFKLVGTESAGNDPGEQFFLRSSWRLDADFDLDVDARYIGALPNPHVPAYMGLNARLGWHATEHVDIVLSGANLAGSHREFGPAGSLEFGPSVLLTLQWRR